ncbi:MAG: PAS domain S-box protein [Gammaproteobacteria bacterium]|nr:PAS domain S-box protein [Gammaproteobacteria bacterium]MBT3968015.1 PAS domain S-box protein [Gammaproteobacteria bacterium]MBT4328619.1 PAS domain S-box protein [Gammaproteobacteria bacterium]MBT7023794.1 PAS domain S-box protein [Gammaproteobacteria bacterium]
MKLIPRTIAIVGSSILLLTATAAFLLEQEMRSELKQEIEHQMVATLSFIRSQLRERVDENRHIVELAVQDPRGGEALQSGELEQGQRLLNTLVGVYPQIFYTFLVDAEGQVVTVSGEPSESWHPQQLIGERVRSHPLFMENHSQDVETVRVSVPEFDPWVKRLGGSVEIQKQRVRWFMAPVKLGNQRLGELVVVERWQQSTGRVLSNIAHNLPQGSGLDEIEYLDGDEGRVIAAWPPDEADKGSEHHHEDTMEWRISLWKDEPAVRYLPQQRAAHHQSTSEKGHLIHIVYEEEEALEPLDNLRNLLYISLFFFALFELGIISWEMRSIVLNRISLLYHGAQALTRGDLSYRLDDKSSDELGDLARSFNQMTAALERAQQALVREKVQSVSILESMQEGVLVLDRSGMIQRVNPTIETLSGLDRDQLKGKPFSTLFAVEESVVECSESQLRIVQERLQELIDEQRTSLDAFCRESAVASLIVDQHGVIEVSNDAMEMLSGWSPEQLQGGGLNPLLEPEMHRPHVDLLQAFIAEAKPRGMQQGKRVPLQTVNGSLRVEIGLFPLSVDGETKVLTVIHDPEDTLLWDIFITTPFGRLFLEQKELYVEKQLISRQGMVAPVQVSGAMLREEYEQGTVLVGSVLVLHDISDRIRAEQHELLAEFQAGVAQMGGAVLHNIGNVITGMSGNVIRTRNKLKKLDKLRTMQMGYAEKIRVSNDPSAETGTLREALEQSAVVMDAMGEFVERLSHSIDEAAELEKIEHGIAHIGEIISIQRSAARPVIQSTAFDLRGMVDDTFSLIEDRFEKAAVELSIEQELSVEKLFLPRNPLMQLLLNLFKNALEAIAEEQQLQTTLKGLVVLQVVSLEHGKFELSVTDNGCGHDPEAAHRLFRTGYTTKEQGSGFGLNSAAKLVHSLGGKIRAESEGLHQGMRMVVTLPMEAREIEE